MYSHRDKRFLSGIGRSGTVTLVSMRGLSCRIASVRRLLNMRPWISLFSMAPLFGTLNGSSKRALCFVYLRSCLNSFFPTITSIKLWYRALVNWLNSPLACTVVRILEYKFFIAARNSYFYFFLFPWKMRKCTIDTNGSQGQLRVTSGWRNVRRLLLNQAHH